MGGTWEPSSLTTFTLNVGLDGEHLMPVTSHAKHVHVDIRVFLTQSLQYKL